MNKKLRHLNICSRIMELDLSTFYVINVHRHSETILQGNLEENKNLLKKFKFTSTDYGFLISEVSKHIKIILT
jgi:hypothetical protein